MLEQISPLWNIYLESKAKGQPLVLATLVKSMGSSYKKPGAMMLIENDRSTHGLISGGCLEADVAEHAMVVFSAKKAIKLEYDLSDESIFGLGAGCDGTIQIVLQLIQHDYLPFSALNPLPSKSVATELYIESTGSTQFPIGNYFLLKNRQLIESNKNFFQSVKDKDHTLYYKPPPKIAVCGAGIDVIPVLRLLNLLQWHVSLIDHAEGRLSQITEDLEINTIGVNPENMATKLAAYSFDATVIMSHNLVRDAQYLAYFAATGTQWLGLLGPKQRRDKVLHKAQLDLANVQARLHAPIGLDIGGDMPENIAISITAQLQQHFYQQ